MIRVRNSPIKVLQVILCCTVCILVSSCNRNDAGEDSESPLPVPVITKIIYKQVVQRPIPCAGIVYPVRQQKLSFPSGGIVLDVHYEIGSRVNEGDKLVTLDSTALIQNWVKWGLMLIDARSELYRSRQLNLKDQTEPIDSEEQAERISTLIDVYYSAKSARLNYHLLAPFKGKIIEYFISPGDTIKSGQPVLLFIKTEPNAIARASLDQEEYYQVNTGHSAIVVPLERMQIPLNGVVKSRGITQGGTDHPYYIEVLFENPGGVAKIGKRVSITISTGVKQEAILIPQDALVDIQDQSASVFLTDENAEFAVRRHVELGPVIGYNVIIDKGLHKGDRLITHGHDRLINGSPIILIQ
ncbi:hypothetical protein CEE37_01175 [candidate division LCP-89 bacterium B3_LCP]|uniref:RND efflux pump membrane fusion protein barrel-sandwich domain-containing protein n=1 Tax=candidate division LCP-89 bacterium B3_LCP TaxID=2012998 RepID=A0A532V560_UNCL8|nr:MAG: hypothetical protein CEE37_01175 [candidate division LCP-89 bacterium B3_LCP]